MFVKRKPACNPNSSASESLTFKPVVKRSDNPSVLTLAYEAAKKGVTSKEPEPVFILKFRPAST